MYLLCVGDFIRHTRKTGLITNTRIYQKSIVNKHTTLNVIMRKACFHVYKTHRLQFFQSRLLLLYNFIYTRQCRINKQKAVRMYLVSYYIIWNRHANTVYIQMVHNTCAFTIHPQSNTTSVYIFDQQQKKTSS